VRQGGNRPHCHTLRVLQPTSVENLGADAALGRNQRRTRRYNGRVPFTIRDFQPSDFETLWSIDQTCFSPGISYSRAELRLYMRRRAAFTVVAARVEGAAVAGSASPSNQKRPAPPTPGSAIVGFLVAEAGSRARGHIITIDVIGGARRFGVGSLLLHSAEDRLIVTGCRVVELETAVDNASALAFYKRHGFRVTRTFPRYYSNGMDALVLEKNLI
jgi:[ribosomal protein S18]-alanine N-acetyltransferase